jgi:monovalent cation:H+ antiporter-2, CPA2 family
MHGVLTDLTKIALVVSLAVVLGFAFMRLRQPAIVGYILAGVVLGPTGLALVENSEPMQLLAELGVLALLFVIGMELSIRAFIMVLRPAVLVVLGQLAASLGVTALFGLVLDWRFDQVLVLAFIVALSSTAVAIKILEEIGELRSETGRITVGIMIAQDIAIVPMLILATTLGRGGDAGEGVGAELLVKIAAAVGVLAGLLYYLSRPGKIRLPFTDLVHDRKDVLALAMLAFCFVAATISGIAGLSAAYGAFIAGLIVSSSTLRAEAISVTEPIQSILVFVFFLSIGLLLDLDYVIEHWVMVASFAIGVVLLKTVFNVLLVRYVGFEWAVALPAGLATAQIGEFSFILAAVGLSNRILDIDSYRLALSVIVVTLVISPLWMNVARRFHDVARAGIGDFRVAMTASYASELSGIGRTGHFLALTWSYLRNAFQASRRIARTWVGRLGQGPGFAVGVRDTEPKQPTPPAPETEERPGR